MQGCALRIPSILAGAKFSTWAWIKIESEIATALRRGESDWFPKEEDPPPPPRASYSNERFYEWTSWGPHGNAAAISEIGTARQRSKFPFQVDALRGGFRRIAKREKPPRLGAWTDLVIVRLLALFATSASCSWAIGRVGHEIDPFRIKHTRLFSPDTT